MDMKTRWIVACSVLFSSLQVAGSSFAAEADGQASTTSLLEQAEADARHSRFFRQSGIQRNGKSYFERSRDLSTPYSAGRLSPSSLREHEWGQIKKNTDDALALRSVTRYFGEVGRKTASRTSAQPTSPVPSGITRNLEMGDPAQRMRLAAALNSSGYSFAWRDHSLEELHAVATRIETADRLRERGFNVDWSNYSKQELQEIANRAAFAEQAMQQGGFVDWAGIMQLAPPVQGFGPVSPTNITTPPGPSNLFPVPPPATTSSATLAPSVTTFRSGR